MSENPQEKQQKPPFDEPDQTPPGSEAKMENAPDYGEKSYRGADKLKGKTAIITGGDSGIGRAVALAFAATKGAIVNFTKGLNKAAIDKGIRVNAVAPGPVWTPLIPSTMPPEQVENFGKDTPIKRPAQPAELAPAYVFLASDEASYISGEILGVTGGKPLP